MPDPSDPLTREADDRRRARSVLPFAIGGLVLAVLLFGAGLFMWLDREAGPAIGGPFTLQNGNGETVTARSFAGKYMLIYFGYTYCPDVCPTTLNEVTAAFERLGTKAASIQPLFITVDPRRDTPAVMKQYTHAFMPQLMGLTGTPEEIGKVEREYHVYAAKHVTGPGPNDYTMDHSSFLYLMGPGGRFIAPIEADASAPELARTLARLTS